MCRSKTYDGEECTCPPNPQYQFWPVLNNGITVEKIDSIYLFTKEGEDEDGEKTLEYIIDDPDNLLTGKESNGSTWVKAPKDWSNDVQSAKAELFLLPVDLEIEDTLHYEDDVVMLHSDLTNYRPKIKYQFKLAGGTLAGKVKLTNPDGRLRFHANESSEPTSIIEVDLETDGEWSYFYVSGENKSQNVDDAKIKFEFISSSGLSVPEIYTHKMTVFWFDQNTTDVTTGIGEYGLFEGQDQMSVEYKVDQSTAVNMNYQAKIMPTGIDTTKAPASDMRIGHMQSVKGASSNHIVFIYLPTDFEWAEGTSVTIPAHIEDSIDWTEGFLRDSDNANNPPLYSKSSGAFGPSLGAPGGQAYSSNDSPSASHQLEIRLPITENNIFKGTAVYTALVAGFGADFKNWTVAFNQLKNDRVIPLRENSWRLLISTNEGNNKANASNSSFEPTSAPVSALPIANTYGTTLSFTRSYSSNNTTINR